MVAPQSGRATGHLITVKLVFEGSQVVAHAQRLVQSALFARPGTTRAGTAMAQGEVRAAGKAMQARSIHGSSLSLYVNIKASPLDRGPEQGSPCSRELLNSPGKVSSLHTARPI